MGQCPPPVGGSSPDWEGRDTSRALGVTPPACLVPTFGDVACASVFADWIEELIRRGITAGCSVTPALYCPADPVTRGQMAVFW